MQQVKMFVILIVCTTLLALTSAQGEEKYSRRYDNIDVDLIFRTRLLNHYIDCLLDKKPCAPEGKDLKRESSLKSNLDMTHIADRFQSHRLCSNHNEAFVCLSRNFSSPKDSRDIMEFSTKLTILRRQ